MYNQFVSVYIILQSGEGEHLYLRRCKYFQFPLIRHQSKLTRRHEHAPCPVESVDHWIVEPLRRRVGKETGNAYFYDGNDVIVRILISVLSYH